MHDKLSMSLAWIERTKSTQLRCASYRYHAVAGISLTDEVTTSTYMSVPEFHDDVLS